ncbi:sensor histidine kinase [Actinomadura keratinilytica]
MRALLVSVLVTGVLGTAFVLSAPPSVRTPLAWCTAAGALLLCVAAVTVARYVQVAEALRERLGSLGEEVARGDQERVRLTGENTRLTEERRRALAERDAALASFANAAGRMQALSTGMLADLRAMQERHSDEDVLADLFHLDHRTAQAGRLADSVAVLSGARSGRRWARPIVMESILRGALGRISGYQRVRTHAASDVHVAGHAAEGVMHVLAELLDNATTFSPPNAEVHVYAEEVPAGLIVSVEDAGLVMSEVQLRRAESAVSGTTDLASLSGTRMGLAVVGRLARKHGLKVSFRPSARGGTGVLVLLPQELLSRPSRPAGPGATATVASPEAREHPFAGLPAAPATAPEPEPAAEAETAVLPAPPAAGETPATPPAATRTRTTRAPSGPCRTTRRRTGATARTGPAPTPARPPTRSPARRPTGTPAPRCPPAAKPVRAARPGRGPVPRPPHRPPAPPPGPPGPAPPDSPSGGAARPWRRRTRRGPPPPRARPPTRSTPDCGLPGSAASATPSARPNRPRKAMSPHDRHHHRREAQLAAGEAP